MHTPSEQLDKQIEEHHKATEEAEKNALAIDQRLGLIPGLGAFLKERRPYSTTRNPWVSGNMSAQGAILYADRSLAVWLASKAGKTLPPVDYAEQAARASAAEQKERLLQMTEEARAKRMAMQAHHANQRINGTYNAAAGKVI
jgi:hypothetical protein